MEAWFLADQQALAKVFGPKLDKKALGTTQDVEIIAKSTIFDRLKKATKKTSKGSYGKGPHSFDVLLHVDPHKVAQHSPSAKRLFALLQDPSPIT